MTYLGTRPPTVDEWDKYELHHRARLATKVSTFFPGVVILFAMSGFLVSASFEKSKDKKEFFMKRVFRMYPELWACTIVNLTVVCLLAYKFLNKSILVMRYSFIIGLYLMLLFILI